METCRYWIVSFVQWHWLLLSGINNYVCLLCYLYICCFSRCQKLVHILLHGVGLKQTVANKIRLNVTSDATLFAGKFNKHLKWFWRFLLQKFCSSWVLNSVGANVGAPLPAIRANKRFCMWARLATAGCDGCRTAERNYMWTFQIF